MSHTIILNSNQTTTQTLTLRLSNLSSNEIKRGLTELQSIQERYIHYQDPLSLNLRQWYREVTDEIVVYLRDESTDRLKMILFSKIDHLARKILVNRFDGSLLRNPVLEHSQGTTWESKTLKDYILCSLICSRTEENPFTEEDLKTFLANPLKKTSNVRSPFDQKRIEAIEHEFAKAMLNLMSSLGLSQPTESPESSTIALKTREEAEESLQFYNSHANDQRALEIRATSAEIALVQATDRLRDMRLQLQNFQAHLRKKETEITLRTQQAFAQAALMLQKNNATIDARIAEKETVHASQIESLENRNTRLEKKQEETSADLKKVSTELSKSEAIRDEQTRTIRQLCDRVSNLEQSNRGGGGGCVIL